MLRVPSGAEGQQEKLLNHMGSQFRVTFPAGVFKQEPASLQCMTWTGVHQRWQLPASAQMAPKPQAHFAPYLGSGVGPGSQVAPGHPQTHSPGQFGHPSVGQGGGSSVPFSGFRVVALVPQGLWRAWIRPHLGSDSSIQPQLIPQRPRGANPKPGRGAGSSGCTSPPAQRICASAPHPRHPAALRGSAASWALP